MIVNQTMIIMTQWCTIIFRVKLSGSDNFQIKYLTRSNTSAQQISGSKKSV